MVLLGRTQLLLSGLQSCSESLPQIVGGDTLSSVFAIHVCSLVEQVVRCMRRVTSAAVEKRDQFPSQLATEWREFFSQAAFNLMLPAFVELAGAC